MKSFGFANRIELNNLMEMFLTIFYPTQRYIDKDGVILKPNTKRAWKRGANVISSRTWQRLKDNPSIESQKIENWNEFVSLTLKIEELTDKAREELHTYGSESNFAFYFIDELINTTSINQLKQFVDYSTTLRDDNEKYLKNSLFLHKLGDWDVLLEWRNQFQGKIPPEIQSIESFLCFYYLPANIYIERGEFDLFNHELEIIKKLPRYIMGEYISKIIITLEIQRELNAYQYENSGNLDKAIKLATKNLPTKVDNVIDKILVNSAANVMRENIHYLPASVKLHEEIFDTQNHFRTWSGISVFNKMISFLYQKNWKQAENLLINFQGGCILDEYLSYAEVCYAFALLLSSYKSRDAHNMAKILKSHGDKRARDLSIKSRGRIYEMLEESLIVTSNQFE